MQQGMSIFLPLLDSDRSLLEAAVRDVRTLYDRMDRAYEKSASCYGFSCKGCHESCCEERFYHYTLSEFLYLMQGIQRLDARQMTLIFSRSKEVADQYGSDDREGQAGRLLCPLNSNGLCSLYDCRPMICRLHGVPYRMLRPDGTMVRGGGCHMVDWDKSLEETADCVVDRSCLYRELSGIEIELRQRLGFGHRIKMTVAEMIVEIKELLAGAA